MQKKKLMILGAGQCQVPIIRKARQMGFQVIAVSRAGNYPGFAAADSFYAFDVRDREQILRAAMKEKICGILTDQTDIPVLTVAYVAEKMNLPGIGYDCALRFTNKYRMRRYCEQIDIPVPRHGQASNRREAAALAADFQYPVILKPVDSQGSRGVIKVNVPEELDPAWQSAIVHSAVGQVIVEEFFQGREIVIEGFMADDRFTNLVIGDREYFPLSNIFIPSRTIFPSLVNTAIRQKLLALNERMIRGFAPKFGISHSEFLVNEETGEIRLVETAIRGGGVFISSDLIPLASGVDVNERLISCAAGESNNAAAVEQLRERAAAYVCFCLPEGRISTVEGLAALAGLPGVHRVLLDNIEPGMAIARMNDKTMRQGPILVQAANRHDLQQIMGNVCSTLRIEVRTARGIEPIIW